MIARAATERMLEVFILTGVFVFKRRIGWNERTEMVETVRKTRVLTCEFDCKRREDDDGVTTLVYKMEACLENVTVVLPCY